MASTCTVTGASGRKVTETTLTYLLREEVLHRVAGHEWFFCPDPDCDVVYFTTDGETLAKDDLTVRVGLKESSSPRPLCYCFGYDLEDVEREAATSDDSAIAAAIAEMCRQGFDRCEETNPQGSCCLGGVRRAFHNARRVPRRPAAETSSHQGCCETKPRKDCT